MGKKGEALRAAKAQTYITMTKEQMQAHDRELLARYRETVGRELERRARELDDQMQDHVREEWRIREELFGGTHRDNLMTILQILLAVPTRILIEHFGWPSLDRGYNAHYRTARFADLLVDEINAITSDEMKDIRTYCDEVYDLYGIRYEYRDEEEDGHDAD